MPREWPEELCDPGFHAGAGEREPLRFPTPRRRSGLAAARQPQDQVLREQGGWGPLSAPPQVTAPSHVEADDPAATQPPAPV